MSSDPADPGSLRLTSRRHDARQRASRVSRDEQRRLMTQVSVQKTCLTDRVAVFQSGFATEDAGWTIFVRMTQVRDRDPLLETKLHVPRGARGLVPRQRLRDRLSVGAGSGLTLISAPAGFGKTTLLIEW